MCKNLEARDQYTRILKRYVFQSTKVEGDAAAEHGGNVPQTKPAWYHDPGDNDGQPPNSYPTPQRRKAEEQESATHDADIDANGPIGLLISSILWHGLKIDVDFNTWQKNEQPVNIVRLP